MRTRRRDHEPAPQPRRALGRFDLAQEPLHPMVVAAPYVVAAALVAVTTAVLRKAGRP